MPAKEIIQIFVSNSPTNTTIVLRYSLTIIEDARKGYNNNENNFHNYFIKFKEYKQLLLLGHTYGPTTATSGFRMLTTDAEAPVVTHTPMCTNFLHSLQIFTEFRIQIRGG